MSYFDMTTPNEAQPINLEVVAAESEQLAIRGTLKEQIAAQLLAVSERVPAYTNFATSLVVKTADDAKKADDAVAAISADEKAVNDKAGALDMVTSTVFAFHRKLTAFRAQFTGPLADAKRTIKTKRDAYDAEQKRLRDEAQRKLDEEARLKREEQERIARVAAQKAEDARRSEEAARAAAAREQDAAKRKALEIEAEKCRKEAEAAAAKEQKHAEKASSVFAPQIAAPETRKGARMMWVAELTDLEAFLKAAVADPNLRGYITVDTTKLSRGKSANSMLQVAGVTFSQKTI